MLAELRSRFCTSLPLEPGTLYSLPTNSPRLHSAKPNRGQLPRLGYEEAVLGRAQPSDSASLGLDDFLCPARSAFLWPQGGWHKQSAAPPDF